MSDAVVIVNTHASYLEEQAKVLGYEVYPIDQYTKNNLNKIVKKEYLDKFFKNISSRHKIIKLVYGSGLEDKKNTYKMLSDKTLIRGNCFNILKLTNNIANLKKILTLSGLKIPKSYARSIPKNTRCISKPINSYGGYNISFCNKPKTGYYFQEYLSGPTYSASFFINEGCFTFLGFNKLFLLKKFNNHPFIHAGAMMIDNLKNSTKIINSIEKFSSLIPLTGYNSIDFKIYNNDIFILDVNPRITSTFKIYNDIYSNMLLNLQLNPKKNYKIMPTQKKNNIHGFVYLFAKENIIFKNEIKKNLWLMDFPIENELVKKGSPLCTIFCSASSRADLIRKLKEKISMTTNHYNCYHIAI